MKSAAIVVWVMLMAVTPAWTGRTAYAEGQALRATPGGLEAWPCGESWASACALQTALANAAEGDEIWAAAGTYTPASVQSADRTASFQLKNGVAVYGGFSGSESERDERDWTANTTILSGDLGAVGDPSDNSYHVVLGRGTADSAVLDGLTIRDGNANGANPNDRGGGLYNDGGSPVLANLVFEDNSAGLGGGLYNNSGEHPALTNVRFEGNTAGEGGGMFNYSSRPVLIGVSFAANSAVDGGGMYNAFSQAVVTNATFHGNTASHWGGGLYNGKCSPILINATLTGNVADSGGAIANHWASPRLTNVTLVTNSAGRGGGIRNSFYSSPVIRNAILWNNTPDQIDNDADSSADVAYSAVQGGYGGTMVIDADPQFIAGTLRLQAASPAVDAGDNSAGPADSEDMDGDGDLAEPLPVDRDGLPRFADVASHADSGNGAAPIVDMGAYETHVIYSTLPLIVR